MENPKTSPIEVTVCDMRAAGKPGYVAKIVNREKIFLQGTSENHGTSAKNITFQIVEDGVYEICDANFGGRKRKIEYWLVVDGEIESATDSLREITNPTHATLDAKPTNPPPVAAYPGLKSVEQQQSEDPDITVRSSTLRGQAGFLVKIKGDRTLRLFLPRFKANVPDREWCASVTAWFVPESSGLSLRAELEHAATAGKLSADPFRVSVGRKAKVAMGMDLQSN